MRAYLPTGESRGEDQSEIETDPVTEARAGIRGRKTKGGTFVHIIQIASSSVWASAAFVSGNFVVFSAAAVLLKEKIPVSQLLTTWQEPHLPTG